MNISENLPNDQAFTIFVPLNEAFRKFFNSDFRFFIQISDILSQFRFFKSQFQIFYPISRFFIPILDFLSQFQIFYPKF